ncbi:MAG TPA: ribbon-helix-helix domain-containing protein [Humisphaera sp.]|jgi:hypothetical protein|nr:ribbon-helix-helix domain-containing protein [Humisphaera sp.]
MSKQQKPFSQMTTAELRKATKEFDKEFVVDTFGPLTKKGRELHRAARNRGGRPRIGAGAKVISISIERELLNEADALAKRRGVSRARLVAEGLSMVLAKAG